MTLTTISPSGRLILETPNASSLLGAQYRCADFTHELAFTPTSLGRLMHLAGFENIQVRECGPVPYGYSLKSTIRYVLWQMLRLGLIASDMVETGNGGDSILTRVFLCSAKKPNCSQ